MISIDVGALGQLYATGFLPEEVWVADEPTEALRRQVTKSTVRSPFIRRLTSSQLVESPQSRRWSPRIQRSPLREARLRGGSGMVTGGT